MHKIFISNSHKDEEWKDRPLRIVLRNLLLIGIGFTLNSSFLS